MRRLQRLPLRIGSLLALTTLVGGCVLAPAALKDEQTRLAAAAPPFEVTRADRVLPDLSHEPDWREVLHRAFVANGDLEAAYFEWKAALARVRVAAAYPNTNVALGFSFLFSPNNMKAWDRTTLSAGFDPMQNLSFPTKVLAAGRVALDDARAASWRFEQAKFRLQRQVLTAYLDYALLGEKLRLQRALVGLLDLEADVEAARLAAGAGQRTFLRAELDRDLAANVLANLRAEVAPTQARLNSLIGRDPQLPLALPATLPSAREIAADDAGLVALVAERNPDVAELAAQVAMRTNALDLARQQYIPDINPFVSVTGGIERAAGAVLSLPATIPRIRAAISEASALLRSAEASRHQAELDRTGIVVVAITALRNAERQVAAFTEAILPAAERIATSLSDAYRAGEVPFTEAIEAERAVLDVRVMIAELRVAREKQLAEIEELAAIDVETLEGSVPTRVAATAEEVQP